MSTPSHRIISIGTLAAHPLWEERGDVRTGHATTTLIETADARIIVDPGLPPQALAARLSERSPVKADEITHVFLTSFEIDHRRGLAAFENAQWMLFANEAAAARTHLEVLRAEAGGGTDPELERYYDTELRVLSQCRAIEDPIVAGVDLFPLPGVTPGSCGLLLPLPRSTVLIAGDAVATAEHMEQGKVLPGCADVEQAMESFKEAIEIADVIIPGRDNVLANPLRSVM